MTRTGHPTAAEPGRAPAERRDAQRARIVRNAWLLAGLAALFYVGFIAWYVWRATAAG